MSDKERADESNTMTVSRDGPLVARGDLAIDSGRSSTPELHMKVALCRCGLSRNKPYCDGSHDAGGFRDACVLAETGDAAAADGSGRLTIRAVKNGPLLIEGPVVIKASDSGKRWRGAKAAMCRCGQSKSTPFCDGSHKAAGFQSD